MTITASILRELHRIHRQRTDLSSRIARGPRQIKANEANVANCEAKVEAAKEAVKTAKIACDERQLQLKTREAKIEDHKAKLNTAASNKEFQTLKDQIAADEQANSVLSDEILEMFDQIEGLEANLGDAEGVLKQTQDELEKVKANVAEKQSGLESELGRVEGELQESEKQLPADFKADYSRLVEARGEEAMAPVDGENCGACYTKTTPQTIENLRMERPTFCISCGAILYLPE